VSNWQRNGSARQRGKNCRNLIGDLAGEKPTVGAFVLRAPRVGGKPVDVHAGAGGVIEADPAGKGGDDPGQNVTRAGRRERGIAARGDV
jgi:hypothetical protein